METRTFIYDGREFPDPDPNLGVEDVRQHYANFFPELSNAEAKDLGVKDGRRFWEFNKRVGSKG